MIKRPTFKKNYLISPGLCLFHENTKILKSFPCENSSEKATDKCIEKNWNLIRITKSTSILNSYWPKYEKKERNHELKFIFDLIIDNSNQNCDVFQFCSQVFHKMRSKFD